MSIMETDYTPCDPEMVQALVNAATSAMERSSIQNVTTPSEVLSASFTILEHTLLAIRKLQAPEHRAENAKEITRVLKEFIIDYGTIPS